MQTRTLGLVACLVVATGLAGCASNPPPSAPPPAPVAAAPPPAPPAPPPMPAGLTPAQQKVAQLQMALNSNGAQLTVDGKMGPATRGALKAFQSSHNLKPTGRADPATVKALGG